MSDIDERILRNCTSNSESLVEAVAGHNRLFAWVEDDNDESSVENDDEDSTDEDEDDSLQDEQMNGMSEARRRRYQMVFSSYSRASFGRRNSDFENDLAVKTGTKRTLLTLFKCFVATGVLFLPKGFRSAGLFAGVITILFVGVISVFGMRLLLRTLAHLQAARNATVNQSTPLLTNDIGLPRRSRIKNIDTYSHVGYLVCGKVGKRAVESSIMFAQVGFCCVYISFIGNSLSTALAPYIDDPDDDYDGPWPLWAYMVATIPIIAPLTLIRHLKHFAIPNLVANVFVLICIMYILLQAALLLSHGKGGKHADWTCSGEKDSACLWLNRHEYATFLGSSVYVFEGITMIIPVQNSMKSPERLPRMVTGVVGSVTLLFGLFGALNFYAYASQTNPIILNNLPHAPRLACTIMFDIVAILMFPLMSFPAARIIEKRLFKKLRRSGYKWQKNFIRTGIVLFCVFVSVAAGEKVDKLVAVIGGMFCTPLATVYPSLFFLQSGAPAKQCTKIAAMFLLLFGIGSSILSTVTAVAQFNS